MDAFYERLLVRAATIDELLSDDFQVLPGRKGDTDLAARRLAAWCRASASGDWSLFGRRLARDRWTIGDVLLRFSSVRHASAPPAWLGDAIWIETALQNPAAAAVATPGESVAIAFEQLFAPLADAAEAQLQSSVATALFDYIIEKARSRLRLALLQQLSELATPAVYERFVQARNAATPPSDQAKAGTRIYDQFIAAMKAGGWRALFEEKPVLLRLIAVVTRQWIDTTGEFLLRLDADIGAIRRVILDCASGERVAKIEGDFSDPHNNGRSVKIVSFEDGARVVYKPKDLRLDAGW